MKRIALVFFLAILLPSILLAALAIRSVRDQSLITNSQRVLFYESTCESVAAEINLFMDEVRIFHGQLIDELVGRQQSGIVETFDVAITDSWSQAAVGAVVSAGGEIITPQPGKSELVDAFLNDHRDFLTNEKTVEVYQAPAVLNSEVSIVEEAAPVKKTSSFLLSRSASSPQPLAPAPVETRPKLKVGVVQNKLQDQRFDNFTVAAEAADMEVAEPEMEAPLAPVPFQAYRNVMPAESLSFEKKEAGTQQLAREASTVGAVSRLSSSELRSRDLTESEAGAVSRLIDGQLHILLWERNPNLPGYTFWTELDLDTIREDLNLLFSEMAFSSQEAVSLALLDSDGELVTQTEGGFQTNWSRPFVASEVGQILPRWEVAAYFINPDSLNQAAETLRWTLSLIVVSLLIAVAVGMFLILKAVRYEMQLATRKTDFVSNVSHELKTPLTSIRLFSELLAETEESDLEKTKNYSGIIHKEAARLSGVPVKSVLVIVYVIGGLCAGFGGCIQASQLSSGAPNLGMMFELYVIAAVVVGGTSLSGGSGKIMGTLIGAFIISVIQNGMNLLGFDSYLQQIVLGAVILGAVLLDKVRQQSTGMIKGPLDTSKPNVKIEASNSPEYG